VYLGERVELVELAPATVGGAQRQWGQLTSSTTLYGMRAHSRCAPDHTALSPGSREILRQEGIIEAVITGAYPMPPALLQDGEAEGVGAPA
jgi:hypothetical protein